LVLWDFMTGLTWHQVWRRVRPFFLLLVLLGVAALLHPGYVRMLDNTVHKRDWIANLDAQARATLGLLASLLFPWQLNFDPDWRLAGWSMKGAVATGMIAGSCAVAWRIRRTQPVLALAVAWLALHLYLPHLLFPRGDVANERQLYWADWPVFLALAVWLQRHSRRWLARAATLGVILLWCALCLQRNQLYADPVLLWQDTACVSPDKARVFNNLGFALQLAGRTDEARAALERALQLDPDSVRARNNLERLEQGARQQ
jgi:tetratricopeptide (TPR) repeat protein